MAEFKQRFHVPAVRFALLDGTKDVEDGLYVAFVHVHIVNSGVWSRVKQTNIMSTPTLSIGAIAAAAHVSVDAVRYYERSGLIPRAPRRPSGYRIFPPGTISRIRLLKSLQRAGFTLADIRDLLQAIDSGERDWEDLRPNLVAVLDRLSADLLAIQKLQQRLRRMLRFCDEGRCPFIRSSPPAEMAVEE